MDNGQFDPAECKAMYEAGGWSQRKLAAHFGVSQRAVQTAINPDGRWWADWRYIHQRGGRAKQAMYQKCWRIGRRSERNAILAGKVAE